MSKPAKKVTSMWRVNATGWIAGKYCQKGDLVAMDAAAARYENVSPAKPAAEKPAKK